MDRKSRADLIALEGPALRAAGNDPDDIPEGLLLAPPIPVELVHAQAYLQEFAVVLRRSEDSG